MGYQSGYQGGIDWTGGGPGWDGDVTAWTLRQNNRQHETPVMGAALRATPVVTVIVGLTQWTANVRFLVSDSVADGYFDLPDNVTVHLELIDGGSRFEGVGRIVSYNVSCPLAGPITGEATIVGSAVALDQTTL